MAIPKSTKKRDEQNLKRIQANSIYNLINKEVAQELVEITEQIKHRLSRSVEDAVESGRCFAKSKELLTDLHVKDWLEEEFINKGFYITHTTLQNYIHLWEAWQSASEEHREAMKKMSLSALYILCRSKSDFEFRSAALDSISQGALPPTREDITDMRKLYRQELKLLEISEVEGIKKLYRKEALKESNVSEDVIDLLLESPIAEDPAQRKKLSSYSKKKQYEIAKTIIQGKASSVKEAYRLNSQPKSIEISTVNVDFNDVSNKSYYQELQGDFKDALYNISSNEIDLAIVECPLNLDWAKNNLSELSQEIYEVLTPGGFAIFILGHKSLMYAAPLLQPLEPLHTLCIRKTPGNSSFIPGSNIIGASVVGALCYKEPFRSPRKFIPDLLTVGVDEDKNENEVFENINEVESGIEKAFDRYIESLLVPTGRMLHIVCKKSAQFGIGHHLAQSAKNFGASKFYTLVASDSL